MALDRINEILNHDLFIECYNKIKECEKERQFCHHDMAHFLDVSRLAMLFNERESLELDRELVYAAGLLHDIGRFKQYQDGTPHEIASAKLAPEILKDCGYNEKETAVIIRAIKEHRNANIAEAASLAGIIYRADKMSRSCFACDMERECNWKNDKKNLQLKW